MPPAAAEPLPSPRPSVMWWPYLGLLALLWVLSAAMLPGDGGFQTPGLALLSGANLAFDALCLAGLYGYLRGRRLFRPIVWRTVVTLVLARTFVSASLFVPNLFPWEATPEQQVALLGLLSPVLSLPLLVALWRYAFRSPHIWQPTPSAA